MPFESIFITLIVIGVVLWLVNTYIPMAGSIRTILNAFVVIVVCLWLLNVLGVVGPVVRWR